MRHASRTGRLLQLGTICFPPIHAPLPDSELHKRHYLIDNMRKLCIPIHGNLTSHITVFEKNVRIRTQEQGPSKEFDVRLTVAHKLLKFNSEVSVSPLSLSFFTLMENT